ncbi:zinc finger protein, partial [Nephila pilipes]
LVNSEEAVQHANLEYTGIQLFKCDLCSHECDSELLLEQHKQIFHQTLQVVLTNDVLPISEEAVNNSNSGYTEITLIFKCDLCNHVCDTEILLEQHKQDCHETSQRMQSKDFLTNSEEAVDETNLEFTRTELLKCDLCSHECDSELLLEEHIEICHQSPQAMETNDFITDSEEAVNDSDSECIVTELLKCDLCSHECESEFLLKQHKRTNHQISQSMQTSDLLEHLKEAVDETNLEFTRTELLKCDLCSHECDSELLLEEHKEICHQTPQAMETNDFITDSEEAVNDSDSECIVKELMKCNLCSHECESEFLLKQHKRTNHQISQSMQTSDLLEHSKDVDETNLEFTRTELFKCDLCSHECDSELLLEEHKEICHQTPQAMETNDFITDSEEAVNDSDSECIVKELMKCDLCPHECESELLLRQHKRTNHQISQSMQTGDLLEHSKEDVDEINLELTRTELLKCDLCSHECDSELLLEEHKEICHQTPQAMETNDFITDSEEAVNDSDSECIVTELLKCDLCSHECESELLLGQHKRTNHQISQSMQTSDLLEHSKEAVDETNLEFARTQLLKCDLCSHECDSELLLEEHKEICYQTPQAMETNDFITDSEEAVNDSDSECIVTELLKCDLCSHECDSEFLLKQHKQTNHYTSQAMQTSDFVEHSEEAVDDTNLEFTRTQLLKCDLCSHECDSELILEKHKEMCHQSLQSMQTNDCLEKSEVAVDDPNSECIVTQLLKCDLCSHECDSEFLLEQHKQTCNLTTQAIQDKDFLANSGGAVDDSNLECAETHVLKCDLCSHECDSELHMEQHKQIFHQTLQVVLTSDFLVATEKCVDNSDSGYTQITLIFKCGLCNYMCDSELLLEQHKQIFHQAQQVVLTNDLLTISEEAVDNSNSEYTQTTLIFKCDLCTHECESELLLEQHKQICHQTPEAVQAKDFIENSEETVGSCNLGYTQITLIFKCDLCSYVCDSELLLGQHKHICHQILQLMTTSDALANSEEAVDNSCSSYTQITFIFKCDLCSHECDSELLLEQHKQICHQTPQLIQTSDFLPNSENAVDVSNSGYTQITLIFKCDLCNYVCDSELLLGQHKQIFHQTLQVVLTNDLFTISEGAADSPNTEYTQTTLIFKCDLCTHECESELLLEQHKQVCFQTPETMQNNEFIANSEEGVDNANSEYTQITLIFKCDLCSYVCDSELLLGQHKHICHQILQVLSTNDVLANSEEAVDDPNCGYTQITLIFKCDLCNYVCDSELLLGQHKQICHPTLQVLETNNFLTNSDEVIDNSNSAYTQFSLIFKCDLCDYLCDSELILAEHKQNSH